MIVNCIFWCWRRTIPALGVNTMPADALAPAVARASADMALDVHGRQHVSYFQG